VGERHYRYVGPAEIRAAAAGAASGTAITARDDLTAWMAAHASELADDRSVTFVVTIDGVLRVAPRRSEHIACAGGGDVLAAGELVLGRDARVVEATNQSTGFCPEPECWNALARALDLAGVPRPPRFTHAIIFRRCNACGQRNIVKDDVFTCGLCDAELPTSWNFGPG
jgi:hypothetical protein